MEEFPKSWSDQSAGSPAAGARAIPFRSPQWLRPESNRVYLRNPGGIDRLSYRKVKGGLDAYPKHRRHSEVVRRQLGRTTRTKSAASTIVRTIGRTRTLNAAFGLIASTACATVRPPSCNAVGGLACSRFDPWQRSVIFIHAVEVDHGLASHLVGPDPLVGDQLISLSLSEFAIAATVLELDEPAPLVVIIVNHDSCTCSDDLRHNWFKPS